MPSLTEAAPTPHNRFFRRHLIAGMVALNLLVITLAGLFLHDSRQQHEAAARVKIEDIALELERDIANRFDQIDLALQALSDSYSLLTRSGQLDEKQWEEALTTNLHRFPVLLVLRATDAQGLLRYGTSDVPDKQHSIADHEEFRRLRNDPSAGLQMEGPYAVKTSRTARVQALVMSRRLTDHQGRFAGIIRAAVPLDHFAQLFAPLRLRLKPGSSISFHDEQLRPIVSEPASADAARGSGTNQADLQLLEAVASHPESGTYRSDAAGSDEEPRLHAYRHNTMHHFYIDVGVGLQEIHAPWWQEAWRTLVLVALFCSTSALLAFWLERAWRGQQASVVEARRQQKELAAQKHLLNDILDTASVAIFTVDRQGVITHANRCMTEMFGSPMARLVGSEYVDHIHPNERSTGRQKMLALLASSIDAVSLERLYQRQDGSEFWGLLTGRRLHVASGNELELVGVIMDIDERKRAEIALQQSEVNFRSLVDGVPFGTVLLETDGSTSHVNRAFQDLLGYTQVDVPDVATWWHKAYPDTDYRERVMREWQELVMAPVSAERTEKTFRVRCANGDDKEISFVIVTLPDNRRLVTLSDITRRRQAERQLKLTASVFSHTSEGIMICDRHARIVDVNQGFSRITGYSRTEVIGQTPRLLSSNHHPQEFFDQMRQTLDSTGQWTGDIWNRHKGGSLYVERLTISVVLDEAGSASHYVCVFSDITSDKLHEQELERIAHFDPLTGLPNRLLLGDRLAQAMAQTQRAGNSLAVCYLDLDGFKPVNDTYGHQAGDLVLIETAQRLKGCLRGGDTVTRLGGDEFVLLLTVEGQSECETALTRTLEAVAQPMLVGGQKIELSASLGVTLFPADHSEPEVLLEHADKAMYVAKTSGKNRFHIYDSHLESEV